MFINTKEKKEITNKTHREINDVGKVIAAKELNGLVAKGIEDLWQGKGEEIPFERLMND